MNADTLNAVDDSMELNKLQQQNERLIEALSAMYYHFGDDDIADEPDNSRFYHPDCVRALKQAKHALRDAGVDTRRLSE